MSRALRCPSCDSSLPEGSAFCFKCGAEVGSSARARSSRSKDPSRHDKGVVAAASVLSLRCPSCGAPIAPRFGEMLIGCEYCGNSITLGGDGWKNVQKHTMLPIRVSDEEKVVSAVHSLMNRGILRWHIWERSTQEELTLSYVPYWIVSVSARTSIVAVDAAAQMANVAAAAAIAGAAAGASGRGGRGRSRPLDAFVLGGVMTGTMGGRSPAVKAYQMSENHNYPVVALRAMTEYQPHDFEFALQERELFEASKIPRGIKVLNGDVGEEDAKQLARTLVDQLQSRKAHQKYSMIQQLKTEIDVGNAELLHVPIWFASYLFKGRKRIVVVVDANSGRPIHTVGIEDE